MTMPADLRLYDPLTGIAWTPGDQRQLAAVDVDTAVVSAQGLDVANFQGNFPWAQVKAHYPALAFGIFKVTEGLTFTDMFAQHNHDAIKAASLTRGMYHFLRPESDGAAQARFFAAQLNKIGITSADMLWCDHEVTDGKTPGQVAACASGFMNELHRIRPHNPKGVYTMISFATGGECAGLGKWPLWLAFPASRAPVPPPPWARWMFWQWGTRNGIDADAFNGTATQLASWLATFQPQDSTGPHKHLTKAGDTLNGIAKPRNTTGVQLLNTSIANWTAGDKAQIASLKLPADFPYFTKH